MLRRWEVGCRALNDHGNYIIDHWKIMEKSWNFVFEFLWEPWSLLYGNVTWSMMWFFILKMLVTWGNLYYTFHVLMPVFDSCFTSCVWQLFYILCLTVVLHLVFDSCFSSCVWQLFYMLWKSVVLHVMFDSCLTSCVWQLFYMLCLTVVLHVVFDSCFTSCVW